MRKLKPTSSLLTVWTDLVFLEAALLARPETYALAAPVTELLGRFDALLQSDLQTRRTRVQSAARVAVADLGLDMALRKLHNKVLAVVEQNRKAALFGYLFPEVLSKLVRYALPRQIEVTESILKKLAGDPTPAEVREGHEKTLKDLVRDGAARIDERSQAGIAREQVRLQADDWKQDAEGVRQSVFGDLVKLAATLNEGRERADTFFQAASERGDGEEAAADDPIEPAGPSPG
jgi:hypothetical protein